MTIAAPLEKVWAFHQDPANLEKLAPAGGVRVEAADRPLQEGSRITVAGKDPLGRSMRLVVRIVEFRPPHAVVFGQEARFVDEQESGPFAFWRHEHDFEAVDAKTTRIVDHVTYRLPLGPLGWLADLLLVRWSIRSMFRHRQAALKRELES